MTRAIVLIFLGQSPEAVEADLESWARARLVELRPPEAGEARELGYDADAAAAIEGELEAARLLFATLDDGTAHERLAQAERLLREHPELPQAPWLLAEKLDLQASAAERAGNAAEAERLRQRAALLEGKRSAPYAPGAPAEGRAEAPAGSLRQIDGLGPADTLYWNAKASRPPLRIAAGEHHARVVRGGRVVWAGFLNVAGDAKRIVLPVPSAPPCSTDDIGGARIARGKVIPPKGALCPAWAVATPAASGGVLVATCRGGNCGALLPWKASHGAVYQGPPQPAAERGLPGWATAAIVGATAVVVGGVIAWRAGVFDEEDGGRPTWRFYGP